MSAGDVSSTLELKGRANMGGLDTALSGIGGKVVVLNQALELAGRLWSGVSATMGQAITASREQAAIFTHLEASLGRAGIAYSDVHGRLSEFFVETQRFTRFGDTDVANAMASIATATESLNPSIETLENYTIMAADVAEAMRIELPQAATIVSKAAAGNAEAIGEVLPAYKDIVAEIGRIRDPAERGRLSMELLGEAFGGAARQIDPFDLALSRINNGIGDVYEGMGDLVTRSPEVTGALGAIGDRIDWIATALSDEGAFSQFGATIESAAAVAVKALDGLFSFTVQGVISLARLESEISGRLARSQSRARASAADTAATIAGGGTVQPQELARLISALEAGGQDSAASAIRGGSTTGGVLAGGGNRFNAEARAAAESVVAGLQEAAGMLNDMGEGEIERARQLQKELAEFRDRVLADMEDDRGGGGGGNSRGFGPMPSAAPGGTGGAADESEKTKDGATINKETLQLEQQYEREKQIMQQRRDDALLLRDVLGQVGDAFIASGQAASESVQLQHQGIADLNDTIQGDLLASVGTLTAAFALDLTDALAAGDFEGFADRALQGIVRMARQTGAFYIAQAIPMMIPNTPSFNPAGAAVYLKYGALLLGGGFLLGLAGGGGGGGGGASAGGGFTPVRDRTQQDRSEIIREQISITRIDTFVSNDPETNRMLAKGIRTEEQLGGVHGVL